MRAVIRRHRYEDQTRRSDFPLRVGSLAAWFDALDPVTMLTGAGATITDGGSVALWADKSGNSGVNCLVLNGASGNYASVPDSAGVSVAGDIDLRAIAALQSWTTPSANYTFLAKYSSGSTASYRFYIKTTGVLHVDISQNGSAVFGGDSTAAMTSGDYAKMWVRVTWRASDGRTQFFYSTDGSEWIQLGSNVTISGPASIFDSTSPVEIGSSIGGGTFPLAGYLYRAQIYASINGTDQRLDIDFSTSPKKLANGDTFTCATGQTVTLNSSGATGARIAGERDLFQGTAANRPVWLQYAGTKYGYLNGTAGNYFSTPDSVPSSGTGDIRVTCAALLPDWTPSALQAFASKDGAGGNRGWYFAVTATGLLRFQYSTDGTAVVTHNSSAPVSFADGTLGYVRADHVAATGVTTFSTSTDGVTWSTLGTTSTGTTGNVFDSSAVLAVGSNSAGSGDLLTGRIYSFDLAFGGVSAATFNPALYSSGTTFTASTGEVWTINGGAHIVTRTGLYGDGVNDFIKMAAANISQPMTVYIAGEQVTWTLGDHIYDGNTADSSALTQTNAFSGASPQIGNYAGSYSSVISSFALKTFGFIRSVYNGASSSLGLNRATAATGNIGTTAARGFTLFSVGDGGSGYANAFVSEVAIYAAAHDTATQNRMALYAGRKHSFAV